MKVSFFGKIRQGSFEQLDPRAGQMFAKAILDITFKKNGTPTTISKTVAAMGDTAALLKAAEMDGSRHLFQGDTNQTGTVDKFLLSHVGAIGLSTMFHDLVLDVTDGNRKNEFIMRGKVDFNGEKVFTILAQDHIPSDLGMASLDGSKQHPFEGHVRAMISRKGSTYFVSTTPEDHPPLSRNSINAARLTLGMPALDPVDVPSGAAKRPMSAIEEMQKRARQAETYGEIHNALHAPQAEEPAYAPDLQIQNDQDDHRSYENEPDDTMDFQDTQDDEMDIAIPY